MIVQSTKYIPLYLLLTQTHLYSSYLFVYIAIFLNQAWSLLNYAAVNDRAIFTEIWHVTDSMPWHALACCNTGYAPYAPKEVKDLQTLCKKSSSTLSWNGCRCQPTSAKAVSYIIAWYSHKAGGTEQVLIFLIYTWNVHHTHAPVESGIGIWPFAKGIIQFWFLQSTHETYTMRKGQWDLTAPHVTNAAH